MGGALNIFAIGFASCYVAVATHVTLNSLYACLFACNLVARARVGIGAMFLLTAIANFVQHLTLGDFGCQFVAKLAIITFHFQMLIAEAFQMYRVSVIGGGNHWFLVMAVLLLLFRAFTMVSDLVLSMSYSAHSGGCIFVQDQYSGILYVTMDAIVELFITITITVALVHHTSHLVPL
ncbi:hypothetical protein L0F63_004503 [Massospora cicadina]|nr:hypothetical protein L0F63_004503 [Massospora cicadina]